MSQSNGGGLSVETLPTTISCQHGWCNGRRVNGCGRSLTVDRTTLVSYPRVHSVASPADLHQVCSDWFVHCGCGVAVPVRPSDQVVQELGSTRRDPGPIWSATQTTLGGRLPPCPCGR